MHAGAVLLYRAGLDSQDEYGVAAAISEDDTPLSIPDEETPPSGNAGTGFWSILFQLLKHLAGKH